MCGLCLYVSTLMCAIWKRTDEYLGASCIAKFLGQDVDLISGIVRHQLQRNSNRLRRIMRAPLNLSVRLRLWSLRPSSNAFSGAMRIRYEDLMPRRSELNAMGRDLWYTGSKKRRVFSVHKGIKSGIFPLRLLPKQRWQQVQITLINGHQLWPILGTSFFQQQTWMLEAKKCLSRDRSKISWMILWSLWQKTKMMKMNRLGVRGLPFTTFAKRKCIRFEDVLQTTLLFPPLCLINIQIRKRRALRWPKLTRYTTAASILLSRHFLPPFTSLLSPFKRQRCNPRTAQTQKALCERCQQTTTLSPPESLTT